MPWNIKESADQVDKEVLKYPAGLHAIKSVVLDAVDVGFTFAAGKRNVVPAGTILQLSATNPNKMVAYNRGTGPIRGILAHAVDLAAQATAGQEPAAMFFHGCVFATTAIVGFTTHVAALVADLNTCKFE